MIFAIQRSEIGSNRQAPSRWMIGRACSKSSVEGPQQSRIAEWFGQALHGALFEQARADCFISVSRNEDDRNRS